MSEAYWFGGGSQPWNLSPDSKYHDIYAQRIGVISSLASTFGLSPARINRVDWFTGAMNGLYRREAFETEKSGTPLSFLWPSLPLLSHAMLQNICAGLILEEKALSVMVEEEDEGQLYTALFGSPTAVGRFNLVPRARLSAHLSSSWSGSPLMDTRNEVGAFLEKNDQAHDAIGALALCSPFSLEELEKPDEFEAVDWLISPAGKGILLPLDGLVKKMEEGRHPAGLLGSITSDRRILFTLVEAV